jgi:hypothetical protein
MLAAILSCGLAITSCNDVLNVIDNPTTTETEQASAKDPGKWWINESYMDKSVKPGDNFFMYCLGTWWKNTTVDPEKHYISRFSEMKPTFEERASSLTDDNYAKYKSHLKWADPNSEAATSAQELYDDALKQSGLLEATTSIDVLRAFGKMSAMGVGSCIKLEPFNYNNKICLFATLSGSDYVEEKANQANTTRSGRQPSIRQIINENPDVMDHLVPLCGRSGTRGISNSWSFIRHILDGMGVDSTQVYFYDDYIKAASTTPYPLADLAYALLKMWQTAFEDQTTGTTTLKALVMDYYRQDYGFISQKTMEEYNTYLNKSDDDTPPTTTKSLSLKKLELSLERVSALPALQDGGRPARASRTER